MSLEDLTEKACYSLRLMHLARWMTGHLVGDHDRRIVGRLMMVVLPGYIDSARAIVRHPGLAPGRRRELRTKLRQLEKDFEGYYATIRHDLAAHRDDLPVDEAIEVWNEIDSDTLDWFLTHSLDNLRELVAAHPQLAGELKPFETEAKEVVAEKLASRPARDNDVARFSTDSLALTRGEVSIIPAHRVQARVGTVLSIVDTLDVTARLLELVGDDVGAYFLLKSGYIIDAVSLIDATYGPAVGASERRTPSLLEILEEDDFLGAPLLRESASNLDRGPVTEIRTVRNRACAHLDPALPLREIFDLIDELRFEKLNQSIEAVVGAIETACNADQTTRWLLISDVPISGLRPANTPGVRPFQRG